MNTADRPGGMEEAIAKANVNTNADAQDKPAPSPEQDEAARLAALQERVRRLIAEYRAELETMPDDIAG